MPSARSVVTLITDFGGCDAFVASMKGVMLGINDHIRIIDVSHQITPHAIEEAAFLLHACYHYFPDGTVHVVVVDPGVGSSRRGLLVTTSRFFFVAPDNGVLSYIFDNELDLEVRQIENRQFRLDSPGATFDGRDFFAPSAAWLTRGHAPGAYGRLVSDYERLPIHKPEVREGMLQGRVASIDCFGNIITNMTPDDIKSWQEVMQTPGFSLHLGEVTIHELKSYYEQGSSDTLSALVNSNGYVEIFLRQGRASDKTGITRGCPVYVR